jgi:fumarate hydratase subunit beta
MLRTPTSAREVQQLRLGDTIALSGVAHTLRDEAHMRALEMHERGERLPFSLDGGAVYHCGPIMEQRNGIWCTVAAGPTTSSRMNDLEPRFIETFGPRVIIGKGGMSKKTLDAMEQNGCVYLAFTGGAAVLAAQGIRSVRNVHWLDLGMPEAVWELELEGLGPLIVAMDAHGNSLYQKVNEKVQANAIRLKENI